MNGLRTPELTVDVEELGAVLLLKWSGKSIDRQPDKTLDPFFAVALTEAASGGKGIEMRFEKLVHLNSSTISCLIRFFQDACARGVKLVFTYDSAISWQEVSFGALRIFAKNSPLFSIRTVSGHEQARV